LQTPPPESNLDVLTKGKSFERREVSFHDDINKSDNSSTVDRPRSKRFGSMGAGGDQDIYRDYNNKRKQSGGLEYDLLSQEDKNNRKWYDNHDSN